MMHILGEEMRSSGEIWKLKKKKKKQMEIVGLKNMVSKQ